METEAVVVGAGAVDIGEDATWDAYGMLLGPDGVAPNKTPISRDRNTARDAADENAGAEGRREPESVNETLQNERGNG